ncbi:MAG: pyridoxal-dependent decarboxylase [Planctomycetota bacterium]
MHPFDDDATVGGMTPEQFRALGHRAVDWIADYLAGVESRGVLSESKPGEVYDALPESPPETPDDWDAAFADLDRVVMPGVTHWQSPSFFGYFPCNGSAPAIIGELLSAGLGVQGMLWQTSPACTELEMRVLDWMAELIGLPDAFRFDRSDRKGGGVIQGTASEAALIALVAARRRSIDAGADPASLCVYTSTQAHSSIVKAAMIAGLARDADDRARVRLIETDDEHRMRADALASAVRSDLDAGRTPCFVSATAGTTSSCAFDPIGDLARAIDDADPAFFGGPRGWLHVDAAYAGAACVCPEFRWMLDGVERADSVCFNPHKWLLTSFDCDCFWVRDADALTRATSVTPEYLRNQASDAGAVVDYRDWQAPLGRRFRALKLWLVLRHFGAEGLRAYIREHVRLGEVFESMVGADDRFELAATRHLNLVCFRFRDDAAGSSERADAATAELMRRVNATGRALCTHTRLAVAGGERYVIRFCPGATGVRERHVRDAWALFQEHAGAAIAAGSA